MSGPSLYRRLLGAAWDDLPSVVRALHGPDLTETFDGRARVTRGRGRVAGLVSRAFALPVEGEDVAVTVTFGRREGAETWRRDFGGAAMVSHLSEGTGAWSGLLVERLGPVAVGFRLSVEGGCLGMHTRRWSLFGVPMPLSLAPRSRAYESDRDGVFRFHVEVAHPLTGLIVFYQGWLRPRPPGVPAA